MTYNVAQRGEWAATFRYIQVTLMETLAQWVPTTPEMEVKLLFGTHIWDVAQHADLLGKRTYELRLPLQFSREPAPAYKNVLDELASAQETVSRIQGFYDVMLPALSSRYESYLNGTDSLMDAPTVRIIQRIRDDNLRMIRESQVLREQLGMASGKSSWIEKIIKMESAGDPIASGSAGSGIQNDKGI